MSGVQEFFSDPASEVSLNSVATGTGAVKAMHGGREVNWYPRAIGACTNGVLVFEHTKESATYTGTWTPLETIDFTLTPFTDAEIEVFPYPGNLGWVRSRWSTPCTSGGVVKDRINGLRG